MLKYDIEDKTKSKLGYIDAKNGVHFLKITRPEDKETSSFQRLERNEWVKIQD